jgi:hypothetical protein
LHPSGFWTLHASLIVSSNKTFSAWAEIFGDAVAVAAMVDRLVHHSEIVVSRFSMPRLALEEPVRSCQGGASCSEHTCSNLRVCSLREHFHPAQAPKGAPTKRSLMLALM